MSLSMTDESSLKSRLSKEVFDNVDLMSLILTFVAQTTSDLGTYATVSPAFRTAAIRKVLSNKIFGNVDLVSLILEFVAEETSDLDTCAVVSRAFATARGHENFDQTRTGTIIFRSSVNLVPRETWERWNQHVFTGNRTRLVAVIASFSYLPFNGDFTDYADDLGEYDNFWDYLHRHPPLIKLRNVHHLLLQRDSSIRNVQSLDELVAATCTNAFLQAVIPNIESLDVGRFAPTALDPNVTFGYASLLRHDQDLALFLVQFSDLQRHLRSFHCISADENNSFTAVQDDQDTVSEFDIFSLRPGYDILRELHVDPVDFVPEDYDGGRWFRRFQDRFVLFQQHAPNLERVTLGRARYFAPRERNQERDYFMPLPQEALIKFVRNSPSLRWFKSDLTPENIAMLKAERPEVEFVQCQRRRA